MPADILSLVPPKADIRLGYGRTEHNFGELRLPPGDGPHPCAIVIHGGFWRAAYDLQHIGHMCEALRQAGVATWSLEYRRVGDPGGGWPGTFDDIQLGAAHLARFAAIDPQRVCITGHSAGGHLALWLASRRQVQARGVVALAAVSDLRRAQQLELGQGAVAELLGGSPADFPLRYAQASPMALLPLGVKLRLLHGTADDRVPFDMSRDFEAAARRSGDDARLITLTGAGHFELIDPRCKEFGPVRDSILSMVA